MIRTKVAIAREIEETRDEIAASAKMAAASVLLRNSISLAAKTVRGFLHRRRARRSQDRHRHIEKPRVTLYRNLGIALGTGVIAGFAYRFWRRSRP
jgi:hypothetical protein